MAGALVPGMLTLIAILPTIAIIKYFIFRPVTEALYAPSRNFKRWRPSKPQAMVIPAYLPKGKLYPVVMGRPV